MRGADELASPRLSLQPDERMVVCGGAGGDRGRVVFCDTLWAVKGNMDKIAFSQYFFAGIGVFACLLGMHAMAVTGSAAKSAPLLACGLFFLIVAGLKIITKS
jgi:hypothetical protein